jgi:hypothetical protein
MKKLNEKTKYWNTKTGIFSRQPTLIWIPGWNKMVD